MTSAAERSHRRAKARRAADETDGVLSRTRLRSLGIDRNITAREVDAGRWREHGAQTIAIHTGALSEVANRWRAVWESGSGAALDGVTALQAAGLVGYDSETLHVSVPHSHGHHPHPGGDIRVHRVRRRPDRELITAGVPRARPAPAALRAAHWADSNRQAALILCMTVQQRMVRAADLQRMCPPVRGRSRRALVSNVIADMADGAHSLGELDFARMCRQRNLPEPSRQVVRKGPRGRIYLDARWKGIDLVVEIDGAQHRQGLAVTDDNLRRNLVSLEGDKVLTIDLIGLRLIPDAFMDQVEMAIRLLTLRSAS